MNEYADLFQPDRKPPKSSEPSSYDSIEAYEEIQRDKNNNKWAFLVYFLVYIVLIGAMGFYFASLYPEPQAILNSIERIEAPSFSELDTDEDGINDSLRFTVSFQNRNNASIESFQVLATFTDIEGNVLFETTLVKDHFQPQEIWTIEEVIQGLELPADLSLEGILYVSNLTNVLFSAAQGVLLISIFFAMQWANFKEQAKRFFRQWKKNLGYVVVGAALVYAAVFVSNIILQLLGVFETSQNEMAIQQMFQNDPLVLWLLFFTLCVAAPITEEIVFRKAIFGFVEPKWGLAPAILISSLVFGSMHVLAGGDWIQIIPYAMMGVAFGYVYHLSGKNLWVVVLIHFINNFLVFLIYLPWMQTFLS